MPILPKSLLWQRLDVIGTDHALVEDGRGLFARGVAVASAPVPYTCHYDLVTDPTWATARLEVSVEGAGWLRNVRLEHAAGRWRVTTAEQGDLDGAMVRAGHPRPGLPGTEDPQQLADAVDVDLGAAPLFNSLPIRRLRLADAPVGREHRITVVWVRVPSLEVMSLAQSYTVLGPGAVRYASAGFSADLTVDAEGYVVGYPGLANRHGAGGYEPARPRPAG